MMLLRALNILQLCQLRSLKFLEASARLALHPWLSSSTSTQQPRYTGDPLADKVSRTQATETHTENLSAVPARFQPRIHNIQQSCGCVLSLSLSRSLVVWFLSLCLSLTLHMYIYIYVCIACMYTVVMLVDMAKLSLFNLFPSGLWLDSFLPLPLKAPHD